MKNKKVSVIIPIYNSEKYVEKCIESVLEQDYGNIELILIDDGSVDRSGEICKNYSENYEHIVYRYQKNAGVSSARNAGIGAATGEYIMFVDSDDRIKHNMVALLVNEIERTCADLCICGYEVVRHDSVTPVPVKKENISGKANLAHYFAAHFSEAIASSACCKLYRKSLVNSGFCHGVSMGEDLLFNLEYIKHIDSVAAISEILYIYNKTNEGSLTSNYKVAYHQQNIYVFNQWLNWFETFENVDTGLVHYRIVNSCMHKLFCICNGAVQGEKLCLIKELLDEKLDASIEISGARFDKLHRMLFFLIKRKSYRLISFFGTAYCKLKNIRV